MNALTPSIRLCDSDAQPSFVPPERDPSEAMRTELEAMQSIAEALARIPEQRVRARVLAWVGTVFPSSEPMAPAAAPSSTPEATRTSPPRLVPPPPLPPPMPMACDEPIESALSLEGIEVLFNDGRTSPGKFPPSPWVYRRRRLSPRLVVRFRWWRWSRQH